MVLHKSISYYDSPYAFYVQCFARQLQLVVVTGCPVQNLIRIYDCPYGYKFKLRDVIFAFLHEISSVQQVLSYPLFLS
jgi:hypothetical protein